MVWPRRRLALWRVGMAGTTAAEQVLLRRRRRRPGRRGIAVGLIGNHDDAVGRVAHAVSGRNDQIGLAQRDGADIDPGRHATGLEGIGNRASAALREAVIVVLGTGGVGAT